MIILTIIQHLEFIDLIYLCGQHLKDVALVCDLTTGQMNQEFQLIIWIQHNNKISGCFFFKFSLFFKLKHFNI